LALFLWAVINSSVKKNKRNVIHLPYALVLQLP
jgi:hypothetical protein